MATSIRICLFTRIYVTSWFQNNWFHPWSKFDSFSILALEDLQIRTSCFTTRQEQGKIEESDTLSIVWERTSGWTTKIVWLIIIIIIIVIIINK
jgi:hypothetical protein